MKGNQDQKNDIKFKKNKWDPREKNVIWFASTTDQKFSQTISGSQVLLTTPSFSTRQTAKSKNSATTRSNGLKVNKTCTASCFVCSKVLPVPIFSSFGGVLNFVNQFCRMATLRKLQLFTQTPMNEVFILTILTIIQQQ